jgi:3-dehydroquinate dehydratase/shikimate dehydrogenase
VTIPHKETAATLARQQEGSVAVTQAANTLVRLEDGGFHAYNTDIQAARESIGANLPPSPDGQPSTLQSRTVLILGAGGVARAVAHALQREGALVTLANRTPERAHKLAEEVGCRTVDWGARHNVICELLINCTSVGMHPNVDETPIHHSYLKPGLIVFDTVYTPETTLLVKEARARGCHVLTGVDMFVRQAALQFQLFTGREAPLELMRSLVKRVLSPVAIREEE